MSARPLFTIIVPTYNRSNLVCGAIESVLAQDLDGVEVIVSDNHSSDDTQSVLEPYRTDSRVTIVSPPEHGPLPQHWEWARTKAHGQYINLLSDDDALVPGALPRIAEVLREYPNTTLVGRLGEYFGSQFPDQRANTLNHWVCPGGATLYDSHVFLKGLFQFWPRLDTHPTGWFFPQSVVQIVARRCGTFFKTNGAEYHAIPAALAVDPKLVHLDEHTGIVGRMPDSIGTKIVLTNPGQGAIDEYVADTEQVPRLSPIDVACFGNLISEGIWSAKLDFPEELARYPKDIDSYLLYVGREFERRRAMGVRYGIHEQQLALLVKAHGVDLHAPDRLAARVRSRFVKPAIPKTVTVNGARVGFENVLGAVRYLAGVPIAAEAPSAPVPAGVAG